MNEQRFFVGMDLGPSRLPLRPAMGSGKRCKRPSPGHAITWPRPCLADPSSSGQKSSGIGLALNVVRPFAKGALNTWMANGRASLKMTQPITRSGETAGQHAGFAGRAPLDVPVYG